MVWCVCGGNVDYKKFDAGSAEWALHYVSKYSLLLSLFTKRNPCKGPIQKVKRLDIEASSYQTKQTIVLSILI